MTSIHKTPHKPSIVYLAPYTENIGAYSLQGNMKEEEYEKLKEKYSEKLLAQALQIKANIKEYAKNFDKNDSLGPEFYIKLAQNLNIESMLKASLALSKSKTNGCPIKDSKWAGYSYEEIIQMEDNGCVIPKEVLQWAHAQQEADVTNYIIVSDNTASEDETSKEDNDINSIQKKVKQYVTQSENAIETSEKLFEEYTIKSEKANKIKKEKENTYKDQMSELTNLSKEWKALDDKKKAGKLNHSEKKRYSELSKQLNGTDGSKMKEVKNTQAELDDFLNSLEGVNNKITENTQLSNDTTNAAKELSKLTRNFTQLNMPHDKKESVVDNGLLSNTLQNVKGDEIVITALKTVEDLDESTNNINKTINNHENTEITKFSLEYSKLATKTEENTKDTMGDEFDKSSEENKEKDKAKDKYHVSKEFSFVNAIKATETTNKSVAELLAQKQTTETNEKNLKKALKQSEKDIKDINKEAISINEKSAQKAQEEEIFTQELESMNKPTTEKAEDSNKNENNETEKEAVVAKLEDLDSDDNNLNSKLKATLTKGTLSTQKGQKLSKLLRSETTGLGKLNNNTKKVAQDTQFVGIGTSAKSILTGIIGYDLVSVGTILMSNPFTVMEGIITVANGMLELYKAGLEFATGTNAIITSTKALDIVATTKDTESDSKALEKDANQTIKENNAEIKEATNATATEENDETQTAQTNSATTDSNSTDSSTTDPAQADSTQIQNEEENTTTDIENKEQQKDKKQKSSSYNVNIIFGSINALQATGTTQQATSEMLQYKANTTSADNNLTTKIKNIEKLTKQNEQNEKQAESVHQKFARKAEQTILKIESSNSDIQNGLQEGNQEKVIASQIDVENNTAELNSLEQKNAKSTNTLSKNITTITSNLKTSQKDASNLKSDSQDYNKLLKNQLNVSEKTTVVGAGTISKGVIEEVIGSQLIAEGTALLATPFGAQGAMMIAQGILEMLEGGTDITTGTGAAVTGAVGIAENVIATSHKASIDKNTQQNITDINTTNKNIQEVNKKNQEKENESKTYSDEINSISASASANANTKDNTSTDDKEDRKLTRFNEDSMIESKKKKKKVMAVSASSRG